MLRIGCCLALLCGLVHAESVDDIVGKSCERETFNLELRQHYTFRQSEEMRRLDKKGATKDLDQRVKEVLWIDGSQYTRLVEKDGKPLADSEAREEQAKMDREIEKRRKESPDQRRKRRAKQQKELAEGREFRQQIPDAFNWTLLGEETVNGYPCYKLRAEPKPGFRPRGDMAEKLLPKMHGTVWVGKADYEWVKVEASTLDTLSFGLALVRIGKGASIELEQVLVNNELWFPQWVRVKASARALLVVGANVDMTAKFHDFRKYQVESNVTVLDQVEPVL